MKKILFILWISLCIQDLNAQTKLPATLHGVDRFNVASKYLGGDIVVSVSLPQGYNPKEDKKYPVLYVLDGYYSFPIMHELNKLMFSEIEPVIIVGIGDDRMSLPEWLMTRYPILTHDVDRYEDSFQVAVLLRGAPVKLNSGNGSHYYDAIKNEVIPIIESNYKTNKDRGITGHSLSGLFTSHVLFKDNGYFTRFGINSAALFVNNDETFRLERTYYESKKELKGRVFISAAGLEGKNLFEKRALNLAKTLKSRSYKNLHVESVIFPEESHVSVLGAMSSRTLYSLYGLPVDRSIGKGHKADH